VYRGIVFDFNGVLLTDGPLQAAAWQETAKALTGRTFTDRELERHMHGRTNRHVFSRLLNRPVSGAELAGLVDRKETLYRRLCLDRGPDFRLSTGAPELLEFLRSRGIPRAIATASGRVNLEFFIDRLGLERWFDPAAIVYDDGTLPGKPAPDAYRRACRNLGLDPPACVVVEDSLSGLESARAAGIGHVVALGPAAERERFLAMNGVDRFIEDLGRLPAGELFGGPVEAIRDPAG
jgi:beta-phosphoglucomutase-like phosphatase (HAD superfamily)